MSKWAYSNGRTMQWEDRIGRRIKFRDLHIALAVSQSGSMLKAAEALAVSQPVVSRVIADLEHALGVRLFDRSRKGVEPTAAGRALLRRGRAAFDELNQGVKEIEFLNDPTAGELRIGTSPTLSEGIVLEILKRLSRQYPRIVIQIVLGGTLELFDELRERRIDLGFARMPGRVPPEDMDQEVLFEDPLVVVAGIRNRWARRRKIELGELVNELWTWSSPGTMFDSLVINAFRANGLRPPRATIYAEATNMKIKLAETGRFLAVVPASAMKYPAVRGSIKVLPIKLSTTYQPSGLITLKHRILSPPAQLFIQCAREVAKPLTKTFWFSGGVSG
jgi:DNA-binding transcriptional LysR family regulator